MRRAPRFIAALLLCWSTLPAQAGCFTQAADYYGIPEILLRAIARVESNHDPRAINHNRDGSRDIGLMQINEWWLPRLAQRGITEADLWDGCVNTFVGAWILAQNYAREQDLWAAVGAYRAGWRDTPARRKARAEYIERIRAALKREAGKDQAS